MSLRTCLRTPANLLKPAILGCLLLLFCHTRVSGQLREIHLEADSSNEVRRVSFYSPNEGYVAFAKWLGYTTDSGRTFTQLNITSSNVNFNNYNVNYLYGFDIAGVKAFDKNTLFVYGSYALVPTILSSSNGGATWTVVFWSQFNPTIFRTGIRDLVFPQNDNIGYAVDADRVLKTTDKGQTWTAQVTAEASYFSNIEAVDDNNLVVFVTDPNGPRMIRTTNGGASWLNVPLPGAAGERLDYAYFLNVDTGWVSMGGSVTPGEFYKTTNGGATWVQQNNSDATPFDCNKMHFVDNNTGYALGGIFYLWKTLNSGVTWEPLPNNNPYTYLGFTYNDLQCYSANQLWAGGGHGYLAISADGGGTPLPTAYFSIDTTGVYATGNVNLINYSRSGYTYQWAVNGQVLASSYNASYAHYIARVQDTIRLIVSSGGISDTLVRKQSFFVPVLPNPTGFSPAGGGAGTQLTITGSGFTNATGVTIGGVPAASYRIANDTLILAVVGGGASGAVAVSDIHGSFSIPGFSFFPASAAAPPVIASVSPAFGAVGTTVTIGGSGFGVSTAANAVFFGSIAAPVQSATGTSIVCTVPPGASYAPLSVLNKTSGLQAQTAMPFNIPFADSSNFTPNSFVKVFSDQYTEGYSPYSVRGQDIDGDGRPDLLATVTGYPADSLAVYPNTSSPGKISFGAKTNVAPFPNLLSTDYFEAGDIDGDGQPDVALVSNSYYISVCRNQSTKGKISFSAPVSVPTMDGSQSLVIADLDNDGKNDIAVATFNYKMVSVVRNTGIPGALAFAPTQNFPAGGNCTGIAVGDLDGDGKKDLVTLNYLNGTSATSSFSFFRNTSVPGAISFAPEIDVSVSGVTSDGRFVAIADVDRDGRPDVIIANDFNLCVFRNVGAPGSVAFAPPVVVPLNVIGQGASMANYSGSSLPDVISGNWSASYFLAYRNISRPGNVGFDPVMQLPGWNPYVTTAADFDGDGRPDLAAANTNDGSVSVYKNGFGIPIALTLCVGNPYGTQLTSDLTGTHYQWQEDKGSGFTNVVDNDSLSGSASATLNFKKTAPGWMGYRFRCVVDSFYSSIYIVKVNIPVDPGVNLAATDSIICYRNPVWFTATTANGSTGNYNFTWLVNGAIITGPAFVQGYKLFDDELKDNDRVQVVLSYYDVCGGIHYDTSRTITMHVTTLTVQIAASDTIVCAGTPVTFTSSTTNVTGSPGYQWRVSTSNAVWTSPSFTTADLSSYSSVSLVLDCSAQCGHPTAVSSNWIAMTVNDTTRPMVHIVANDTAVCAGATVNFTATETGGGNSPGYEWLVNGSAAGGNSTSFSSAGLRDNDRVECVVTSSQICTAGDMAGSNPIIMHVKAIVVPQVAVAVADTVVCPGAVANFSAIASDGGSAPHYQWTKNSAVVGGDAPTYTDNTVTGGEVVVVRLVSSESCASPDTVTSQPVVISLDRQAPVMRITGDTAAGIGVPVEMSASTTNGVGVITYQWQDSTGLHSWQNIGGAVNPTLSYIFSAPGDKIRCLGTGTTGCLAVSNTLTCGFDGNAGVNGVRYYPNPATTVLYIVDTDPGDPIDALSIASATGNPVIVLNSVNSRSRIAVDVATLNPGMYFVTITRSSGSRSAFSFIKR
ncbi:FG-GAP-like repeat-containing protein [Puia dinghuensis]|uniref:T9SS type A sorting domain-containing protein n=1 Tax=Puia dinghuensis TaxID=1792502 RepID=A0A8J2XQR8_9BACT|nr:FG-GAP-like repeat-containing protein [Puia dinghuensis]GGA95368.1 hypothetical protein GCM10011511_18410 [Puia dinghuensis]